jgi:hypothetical protein
MERRRFTIEQIARLFRVPTRLIYGDPRARRAFRLYRQRRK